MNFLDICTTTLLLHFKAFSTLYEINLWWSSADYHDTGHQRRRPSQRRHDSPTASAFGFLLLLVTSRERLRSWCREASLSSHYYFRSKDRWSACRSGSWIPTMRSWSPCTQPAISCRGKGIGRAMVSHLLGLAKQRGFSQVSLETGTNEAFKPARDLYDSFGFKPCEPFGDYLPHPISVCMTLCIWRSESSTYTYIHAYIHTVHT